KLAVLLLSELFHLLMAGLNLPLPVLERSLLPFQVLDLTVERLFLLLKPPLEALDFLPAFPHPGLGRAPSLQRLVTGLEKQLLAPRLGLRQHLLGAALRHLHPADDEPLAEPIAHAKAGRCSQDSGQYRDNFHSSSPPP